MANDTAQDGSSSDSNSGKKESSGSSPRPRRGHVRQSSAPNAAPGGAINIYQLERQWSHGRGFSFSTGEVSFSTLEDSADSNGGGAVHHTRGVSVGSALNTSWVADSNPNPNNGMTERSYHQSIGPMSGAATAAAAQVQSDLERSNSSNNHGAGIVSSVLHDEARITNWSRVLQLCNSHPETAQYCGPDGWTALHHACNRRCDRIDVMEALIKAYPEALLEQEEKDMTPLHYAARFKAPTEAVKLLLDLYPNHGQQTVKLKDRFGRTPLLYAVRYDAPPGVMEALLRVDASVVLEQDKTGESPLSVVWDTWAEKLDGKRTLQSLILQPAMLSPAEIQDRVSKLNKLRTCWEKANKLLRAAYPSDPFLILHVTSSIKCHLSLFLLSKALYPEQVMEKNANNGRTALHLAALSPADGENGKTVVNALLTMYPDAAKSIDSVDKSLPFHLVVGNKEKAHWVHDGVRDIYQSYPHAIKCQDKRGRLPLHYAAASAHLGGGPGGSVILELLQEYPEAASHADECRLLPMHYYAENQSEWDEEAESLYGAHEAAVRARGGSQQRLPLHFAVATNAKNNKPCVVEKLVELNPRACSQADSTGKLPLHLACEAGKDWVCGGVEKVYNAFEAGVRTKEENERGWLPLQIAAASKKATPMLVSKLTEMYPEAAQELDEQGRRALHLACESGKGWNEGVRVVFQAYPEANFSEDKQGQLPFHKAALKFASGTNTNGEDGKSSSVAVESDDDDSTLNAPAQIEVLFELLRAHPIIIQ